MNNFIKEIPELFSEDFCNRYINVFEELKISPVRNEYNFNGIHEEYKYLDSYKELREMDREIQKKANEEVSKYLQKLKNFYPIKSKLDGVSVLRLKKNCMLDLHYDPEITYDKYINLVDSKANKLSMKIHNLFRKKINRRHLSVLMYLQEMEGGELYFPLQEVLVKPKPGLLVIFPTFFTHPHTVLPPLNKDRYTYRFNYILEE
jgi:hypothetical protein